MIMAKLQEAEKKQQTLQETNVCNFTIWVTANVTFLWQDKAVQELQKTIDIQATKMVGMKVFMQETYSKHRDKLNV